MRRITSLALIFLFTHVSVKSQNKKLIDSLTNIIKVMPNDTLKVGNYGILHEQLMFSNPELARDYAKKALSLSKKLDYKTGIASSYIQFGNYYYNQNLLDSAKFHYKKGLSMAQKNAKIITQIFANHSLASIEKDVGNYDAAIEIVTRNIDLYNNNAIESIHDKIPFNLIGAEYELLGQIHLAKGNNNIALKEAIKALDFFKKVKDEIRTADALKLLGQVEYALENYTSSIIYSKEALEVYKKNDDLFYQSTTANQIGNASVMLNKLDEATKFFKEASILADKTKASYDRACAITGLGNVYFNRGDFDKAKEHYQSAYNIFKDIDYKNQVATSLSLLAKTEYATRNWVTALDYANQSINIYSSIGAIPGLGDDLLFRSKIYEALNQTNAALADLKQFQVINDSLYNDKKTKQIEELRTIYETEKKEQQIQLQKNEIDILTINKKVNNQQRILLALGLLLALIGMYALYQRNKRNRLEKEKAQADLEFKTKELTTHALHLAKKNEVLNDLKEKAKVFKADANADPGYQMLIQTINFDLQDDNNWENFSKYFEEVHKDFNTKAQQQFPNITKNDLRLMALLKMNLSSKEIANILNISSDGIKKARQRLRKKMGIDSNESLEAVVIAI